MGNSNIRGKPVVKKDLENCENHLLWAGCCSMEGFRTSMEDKHTMRVHEVIVIGDKKYPVSFFGVLDGHSGARAAKICAEMLCDEVMQFENERIKKGEGNLKRPFSDDETIIKAFLSVDSKLKARFIKEQEDEKKKRKDETSEDEEDDPVFDDVRLDHSGTTCISCIVVQYVEEQKIEIISPNIGDSRCICFDGKTVVLSKDHKPTNPEEQQRIEAAKGYVHAGRVNGTLALSRAFGDFQDYKQSKNLDDRKQQVVALPEIRRYFMSLKDEEIKNELPKDAMTTKKEDEDYESSSSEEEEEEEVKVGEGEKEKVKKDEKTEEEGVKSENVEKKTEAPKKVKKVKRKKVKDPEIDKHRYIVLACDGIWDVRENHHVNAFVRHRLQEQENGTFYKKRIARSRDMYDKWQRLEEMSFDDEMKLEKNKSYDCASIMGFLCDRCVLSHESKDNVTAMLVLIKKNPEKPNWDKLGKQKEEKKEGEKEEK